MEVDHILPRSQGGNGTGDNAAPCCRSCNRLKGAKLDLVFLARGFYVAAGGYKVPEQSDSAPIKKGAKPTAGGNRFGHAEESIVPLGKWAGVAFLGRSSNTNAILRSKSTRVISASRNTATDLAVDLDGRRRSGVYNPTVGVSFRLSLEDGAFLDKLAVAQGMSRGNYMRRITRLHIRAKQRVEKQRQGWNTQEVSHEGP